MVDSYFELFNFPVFIPAYAKQLFIAAIIGLTIGVERHIRQKVASLRTFALICTGSCLFTILSVEAAGNHVDGFPYDLTRVAAGIVTGIGFVGGGVVFKTANRVRGVTTAAMIWLAAAIGMAVGFNMMGIVFWSMVMYFFIITLSMWIFSLLRRVAILYEKLAMISK